MCFAEPEYPGSFSDFVGRPENVTDIYHAGENIGQILEHIQQGDAVQTGQSTSVTQSPPQEIPVGSAVISGVETALLAAAFAQWIRDNFGNGNESGCH